MPSRFDPESNPKPPKSDGVIDSTKRYDVHCIEHGLRTVVYRNVLFQGARTLFGGNPSYDVLSQYLELEQANGQTFFIGRHGLLRFCEHGSDISFEEIYSK